MFDPKGPTFFELARQALSSTTKGYDLLAPKFEYTPFRTPDLLIEPLVEVVNREPTLDFLDIACGTGAIARKVAPSVEGRTIGIDISTGMLNEGRALAKTEGVDVIFQEMDLFDMRFHEQFDVVATAGAFGHILEPEQPRFVELVYQALKPGGRFIFITGPMPAKSDPIYWLARGFNAAMHVRNALIQPPFIMFYLTFTLEQASELLWKQGFDIRVEAPWANTDYHRLRLVIARKPHR
jgi:cyclopropane fatty-acyl-phospholipid synthase-like methyltransferase